MYNEWTSKKAQDSHAMPPEERETNTMQEPSRPVSHKCHGCHVCPFRSRQALWMWTFCLFFIAGGRVEGSTTRLVFLRLRPLSCPWPFCSLNTSRKQRTSLSFVRFEQSSPLCALASPFLWKSSLVRLYPQDPIASLSLEPPHRISPRSPATCFHTQASNSPRFVSSEGDTLGHTQIAFD